MEIRTPFAMALGVVNIPDALPYLRQLFVNKANECSFKQQSHNHSTTLKEYNSLEYVNDLDDSKEADYIRDQIKTAAVKYAVKCGYSMDNYEPVVVGFWLNETHSGGGHQTHNHPGLNLSGCIYVDMPKNTSGIRFHSYRVRFDHVLMAVNNYTAYNAGAWDFSPKEGEMYLWESWMPHEVLPAEYVGVRRSAAFDVVMKSKFKDK